MAVVCCGNFLAGFKTTLITFVVVITFTMGSEGSKISEIKKVINSFLPESEVIMIGSRAKGDNQPNSDYDLLIISRDPLDDPQRMHFQALIRKSLAKQNILADIIIYSRNVIEAKSNLPGHIVRAAIREGVHV